MTEGTLTFYAALAFRPAGGPSVPAWDPSRGATPRRWELRARGGSVVASTVERVSASVPLKLIGEEVYHQTPEADTPGPPVD